MEIHTILACGTAKAEASRRRMPASAPIKVDVALWEQFQSPGREAYFGGINYTECPYTPKDCVKWEAWLIGWWSEHNKERRSQGKVIKS